MDNSLHREFVKLEHARMRFVAEPPSRETLPLEISELDLVLYKKAGLGELGGYHENRDFAVLPNYQPHGTPTFDSQTEMGARPSVCLRD